MEIAAPHRVRAFDEHAFHVLVVEKPRAIHELVEHPRRNDLWTRGDLCGLRGRRAWSAAVRNRDGSIARDFDRPTTGFTPGRSRFSRFCRLCGKLLAQNLQCFFPDESGLVRIRRRLSWRGKLAVAAGREPIGFGLCRIGWIFVHWLSMMWRRWTIGGDDFGLRWQSAAATPLFDLSTPDKAAWRFASRRSLK
jgi:hypothetical protein